MVVDSIGCFSPPQFSPRNQNIFVQISVIAPCVGFVVIVWFLFCGCILVLLLFSF